MNKRRIRFYLLYCTDPATRMLSMTAAPTAIPASSPTCLLTEGCHLEKNIEKEGNKVMEKLSQGIHAYSSRISGNGCHDK